MNPDELPQTDERLNCICNLNYKPAIEIAEEEAINTIFDKKIIIMILEKELI
jgi:hypothetical protein